MTNAEYLNQKSAESGPRLTEHYILAEIRFHESGAEFYGQHDQPMLADWSRGMAADWRKKLEALRLKQITGEGSIQ